MSTTTFPHPYIGIGKIMPAYLAAQFILNGPRPITPFRILKTRLFGLVTPNHAHLVPLFLL
jgi:hypothetical protein